MDKREIALSRNIRVDDEDMWLLDEYTWYVNALGYVVTNIAWTRRIKLRLHHAIMGQPIYEEDEIDHIDRNKLNNQRYNLRWSNRFQQMQNHSGVLSASNIYLQSNGRYRLQITRDGVTHVEMHKTEAQAIAARDRWLATQELIT